MDGLMNNAPCGFLIFTDDGKITDVNATLLRMLGCEPGELIGLHFENVLTVAGRIFFQTHFFPLLKLENKIEEVYLDLKSKSGENIPVLVNAVRRERGETIFNDCVFLAMRQRNVYEDEIIKAKKEAEAATVAKDEFLSVVSHELRTPLNAILGWATMLQNGRADDDIRRKGIDTILRNAQIQTRLIEDILDFSRIITGKLRIEVGEVDFVEVIESAIDVLTPAAEAKAIKLETVFESESVVSGDASRLQQVLWNLLTNAVKFTPNGGCVLVRLRRVKSNVEISVIDTEQGISAEFLPFIFERFQQQDKSKSRRYGGLGLGLAISYRIIELHGGTIRAESDGEGKGATFTIRLPAMKVKSKTKPVANEIDNSV